VQRRLEKEWQKPLLPLMRPKVAIIDFFATNRGNTKARRSAVHSLQNSKCANDETLFSHMYNVYQNQK
jgi:phage antirepressor YoqD-like protein